MTIMKWLIIPIMLVLPGCAAYTVASTLSAATTGKTLSDHTLTQVVPNSDCDIWNLLNSKYYCEIRDISTTYNRTGL